MTRSCILHIMFEGPESLATEMIEEHRADASIEVKVIDMLSDPVSADTLVDEIFSADKVFSWHG